MDRFARHVALADFGKDAQQRLRSARVLVVGVGGLGTPVARYLAAAGVGHLTLVDFGKVDPPDLQRQILYGAQDIGQAKAAVAARWLQEAHPDVDVHAIEATFDPTMVTGHDVVIDGTDEAGTRALVHASCIQQGIPLVWGALEGWDAQVTTVLRGGPCIDCLFPAGRDAPACSDVGVFGPLAGIAGTVMAAEAAKVLAGHGTLSGTLLQVDARTLSFETVRFARRVDCPSCSGATK